MVIDMRETNMAALLGAPQERDGGFSLDLGLIEYPFGAF